jgi:hypothetical protein
MSDDSDLERYATISAELARAGAEFEVVLARHGLDDTAWERLVQRAEALLDREDPEEEAAELERFAGAFARARARTAGPPVEFDVWLGVVSALRRGEALLHVLERAGLTLDAYLSAQSHWAPRVAREPELLAKFQAAMLPDAKR